MTLYLTRNEIIFCFGVYFLAFAYGLYHAYVAGAGESFSCDKSKSDLIASSMLHSRVAAMDTTERVDFESTTRCNGIQLADVQTTRRRVCILAVSAHYHIRSFSHSLAYGTCHACFWIVQLT